MGVIINHGMVLPLAAPGLLRNDGLDNLDWHVWNFDDMPASPGNGSICITDLTNAATWLPAGTQDYGLRMRSGLPQWYPLLPRLVGQVDLVNQAANNAGPNILSPATAGFYQIQVYLEVTTVGTTGGLTLNLSWTDDRGANANVPIAPAPTVTSKSLASIAQVIYLASGQITWSVSGWVTPVHYALRMRCIYNGA